jgi:redox-sensitive bicupin YhaK (pirin superfamily)
MLKIRKAEERGRTRTGWLDGRHTFSFNRYYDPDWMGFGPLRVINDDLVAPSGGFPTHPHQDMEILTWVLEGTIAHKDSTGATGEIRPGDLQKMSAGTGIFHSEFNPSDKEGLRLLQIWIEPEKNGLPPTYEDRHFPLEQRLNKLLLIAAENGRDGAVPIYQKADLYTAVLDEGAAVEHRSAEGRRHWVQVAKGAVEVNGTLLKQGDGAALTGETQLRIHAASPAEIMLFDMA